MSEEKKSDEATSLFAVGGLFGGFIGAIAYALVSIGQSCTQTKKFADYGRKYMTPIVLKETGTEAKPSELEIMLRDLDGDGQKETILLVKGQQYLMRMDADGKTQLLKYRIETKPVVPESRKIITEQDSRYQIQK